MYRVKSVVIAACLLATNAYAATKTLIWTEADKAKLSLTQSSPFSAKGLLKTLDNSQQVDYQLQLIGTNEPNAKHARYQQLYRGIPIWGEELIFHAKSGKPLLVTGEKISGVEQDLTSIEGKLSAQEVEDKVLSERNESVKWVETEKVIFIDDKEKALLAYHASFYTNTAQKPISAPNYLVDADTGKIIKQWDDAHEEALGQGLGGNGINLPYRSGIFQHGDALPGIPSLGKFDVEVLNDQCYVQNDSVRTVNLENAPLGYDAFPVTVFDEARHHLQAFSYPCEKNGLYINYADGQTGPVNYSFSPVNDSMYFADKTLVMYEEVYGVKKPIGDDLPLRAYTHLGNMDNAFAIPTINRHGLLVAHQQIVIGNRQQFLTAPTQSVIAHELSHKPGWSTQMAFQVMLDANRNYWSPIAYFEFAACGVIQAALDRELDPAPVIEAFDEVGVSCPIHKK